jgi:hypothetical protein
MKHTRSKELRTSMAEAPKVVAMRGDPVSVRPKSLRD